MGGLQVKRIIPNGDCAFLIECDGSPEQVQQLAMLARTDPMPGVINVVPGINCLGLAFADAVAELGEVEMFVDRWVAGLSGWKCHPTTHEIPVCYHPSLAVDLPEVMQQTGLTQVELSSLHASVEYTVTMLGFLPGFAYLNDLPKALNVPRKSTPSLQVQAGSVAIAGRQCGLYAINSPGGWSVIGRTPMRLFDADDPNLLPYRPLDRVRFVPISLEAYHAGVDGQ